MNLLWLSFRSEKDFTLQFISGSEGDLTNQVWINGLGQWGYLLDLYTSAVHATQELGIRGEFGIRWEVGIRGEIGIR